MLKRLKYEVTFPSTGRTLQADIDFSKGLTAISGSNESGKTTILEMIRYSLWGSKALRGAATDYKSLKTVLEFIVKGVEYRVHRLNGNKADLFRRIGDDEWVNAATGTKPVNAKIIEIFGYDLTVFDVANNVGQGEVERLGTMRPADRKQMVDQTIGLNILDDLADWLAKQASTEIKVYETLVETLAEPVAPTVPADYVPAVDLAARQDALSLEAAEFHQHKGWLSARASVSRPDPVIFPTVETAAELRALVNQRNAVLVQVQANKQQLKTLQPSPHTAQELDGFDFILLEGEAYKVAAQLLADYPVPEYTADQLMAMTVKREKLEVEAKIAHLENNTQDCPKCGHNFPHDHHQVERLRTKLAGLAPTMHVDVCLPEAAVTKALDYLDRYEKMKATLGDAQITIDEGCVAPKYTASQIAVMRSQLGNDVKIAELTKAIEIELPADRTADLHARVEAEMADNQYRTRMAEWDLYLAEKGEHERRMAELDGCVQRLHDTGVAVGIARAYEAALENYTRAKTVYDTNRAKADASKAKAEKLEKGRKAIKALKGEIKSHLVPSLNKVASHLISQMTATSRNSVVIDENFDIEVDGQPLNTLSGSGKAVANLAIRIGLGQVLTNRVFSVLMGDEIDASMDEDRAGYTAECLERLTSNIGQVVLVSHKTIDAEHHIQVS